MAGAAAERTVEEEHAARAMLPRKLEQVPREHRMPRIVRSKSQAEEVRGIVNIGESLNVGDYKLRMDGLLAGKREATFSVCDVHANVLRMVTLQPGEMTSFEVGGTRFFAGLAELAAGKHSGWVDLQVYKVNSEPPPVVLRPGDTVPTAAYMLRLDGIMRDTVSLSVLDVNGNVLNKHVLEKGDALNLNDGSTVVSAMTGRGSVSFSIYRGVKGPVTQPQGDVLEVGETLHVGLYSLRLERVSESAFVSLLDSEGNTLERYRLRPGVLETFQNGDTQINIQATAVAQGKEPWARLSFYEVAPNSHVMGELASGEALNTSLGVNVRLDDIAIGRKAALVAVEDANLNVLAQYRIPLNEARTFQLPNGAKLDIQLGSVSETADDKATLRLYQQQQ